MNEEHMSQVKHNQILDLSVDGDRWEGDVLNDKPFGWGVLYDGEGRMVYEGFRIGDVNVCYGRSYYSDVERVEYEGEICESTRCGQGTQYDRNGNAVFDDDWENNGHLESCIELTPENDVLTNHVEKIEIGDDCYNEEGRSVLDLGLLPLLRVFSVGTRCFQNVRVLRLVGLRELECVVIGANCFTKRGFKYGSTLGNRFCLKNCPKLKSLKIGHHSFSDYTVCEIEDTPGLEVIEMGVVKGLSHNFYHASLELRSIPIH